MAWVLLDGEFFPKKFQFFRTSAENRLKHIHGYLRFNISPLNFKFFICLVNVDIKPNDIQYQNQNFGDPFLFVIYESETLADVKLQIQKKLQVPDVEFSKVCMYVLIQLSALALLFRPFKAWSTFLWEIDTCFTNYVKILFSLLLHYS